MDMDNQYKQQDLERIKNLRYIDDDFMVACFDENYEAVELVLRIIMGKADLKVQDLKIQRVLKNLQGRSAVVDVHAIDGEHKEYDIEIQKEDAGAGAKRARHNSSLLDAHILKPGQEPDDMPESYVIFITENDVMKGKQPIYTVDRYVTIGDEKVLFNDGSHILYVNGAYRGNDDIGKLMHDFMCKNPEDMNFEELAKKAKYFKCDEKGVAAMCKMMEDMRKETELNNSKNIAIRMIKDGRMSLEDIANFTELSLETIKEIEQHTMQLA